jgi:hypothetical protein
MAPIDRRAVLRDFLPGAIVAAAGVAAAGHLGMGLVQATPAEAAPLTIDQINALRSGEPVEMAQVVVGGPPRRRPPPARRHRRRRRRWVCWRRRGRRVCGWRWI